jgi:hypothetical protein
MIQSVAAQLIGQFGECLRARILEGKAVAAASHASAAVDDAAAADAPAARPAPAQAAKPISGFSLLFGALLASLRNLFGGKKP